MCALLFLYGKILYFNKKTIFPYWVYEILKMKFFLRFTTEKISFLLNLKNINLYNIHYLQNENWNFHSNYPSKVII